jgi:hypothetical protein
MESGNQQLEIAPGLKESLLRAGLTIESIVLEGLSDKDISRADKSESNF